MGWAFGEMPDGTPVGYGVPDVCHEDGCGVAIDRGLAYVCGGMHGGDGLGCGGYYCYTHLFGAAIRVPGEDRYVQGCARCAEVEDDE